MLQLYKNIKSKRTELGMTQSELAKKLGYADKSMIAKVEKGVVDLTQSKIIAFAEALDTSPSDLMGYENPIELFSGVNGIRLKLKEEARKSITDEEIELIDKYRHLSDQNKTRLFRYANTILSAQEMEDDLLEVVAAHERTDIEVTDEMRKHDDDLMDGDW